MIKKTITDNLRFFLWAFILAFGFAFLQNNSALAAGETYTWQDYRTIKVSGGDLMSEGTLIMTADVGDATLSGTQTGRFSGKFVRKEGCRFSMQLFIFDNINTGGTTWNPPPYDTPEVGNPQQYPRCGLQDSTKDIDATYHNKMIAIAGTRPSSGNQAEQQTEKYVRITLNSPKPLSQTAKTTTVTIKNAGGDIMDVKTVAAQDDSGAATYPPDQTPAIYVSEFHLEPGKYKVCFSYGLEKCQDFTKVKFKALTLVYGDRLQTAAEKSIEVTIKLKTSRPCGQQISRGPYDVTATGGDGSTALATTGQTTTSAMENESDSFCSVELTLNFYAVLNDVKPGEYKVCSGSVCNKVTKKDGEQAKVTLEVEDGFNVPDQQPVCSTGTGFAGMLAWTICPLLAVITSATDFIQQNLIIPYLSISPLKSGDVIYQLWQAIRNFANIGFIIAFLIIIFSQATSIGLSNYGIKKLLPKMGIVVIGTNLSYFIVAFLIDAFNVIGAGIAQLVLTVMQQTNTCVDIGATAGPNIWQNLVFGGAVLVSIIATGGGIIGMLFPLIIAVFVIVLATVVVLVLRQMMIIILVIISPFAFLAWLLPNTAKFFTKWWKLLIKLLMMYPYIILLFAAGKLIQIMISCGNYQFTTGAAGSENAAEIVRVAMGAIASILPLIGIPLVFAASGNTMNKLYGRISTSSTNSANKMHAGASRRLSPLTSGAAAKMASSQNKYVNFLGNRTPSVRKAKSIASQTSRERELELAKKEYLANLSAGEGLSSEIYRAQAAGFGGEKARQRVKSSALAELERLEKTALDDADSLFQGQLRDLKIDSTDFVENKLADYLNEVPGSEIITGYDGTTQLDLSKVSPEFMRAALHAAGRAGDIGALEAARISSKVDQRMLSNLLKRPQYKSAIEGSGGKHLVDKPQLAYGVNSNDRATLQQEMLKQRFDSMMRFSVSSLAKMDYAVLESSAAALQGPARQAIIDSLNADGANGAHTLKAKLQSVLSNENTRDSSENIAAIERMMNSL